MSDPIETDKDAEPVDPDAGIGSLASGALASFIDHFEARLELLRLEALEVRSEFFRRLLLILAGGACLGIAYLTGLTGLISWLSKALETGWYIVALWAAAIHLLGGIVLGWIAKRSSSGGFFGDSIKELRKDRDRLRRKLEPTPDE